MSDATGEHRLIELLLRLAVVDRRQLQRCKNLQLREQQSGNSISIETLLLRENYLTGEQMELVKRHLKAEMASTQSFAMPVATSQNANMIDGDADTAPKNCLDDSVIANSSLKQTRPYLGRYQIIEEVGRGGTGKVFKAHDPQLQRIVALKLLLPTFNRNELARFLREAKATARLRHPNIVSMYDIGNDKGKDFFIMDFVEGKSLKDLLTQSILSIEQIVEIMRKVGKAIQYAHSQGVIHRDLKPSNIMMDCESQPKVMDFGIAKIQDASVELSESGMMLGTLAYMPPEQAKAQPGEVDERSDVYALGAVLYELLTGQPPFIGRSYNLVYKILNNEPTPPRELEKTLPKNLESICLKALRKKKNQRYSSAARFVEDLARFAKNKPIEARPLGVWERCYLKIKNHKMPLLVLPLILLLGLVLGSYFPGTYKTPDFREKALRILRTTKPSGHFAKSIDSSKLLLDASLKRSIALAIAKNLQARLYLEQARTLSPNDNGVREKIGEIEKEISLLSKLARNYLLSKVFLERYKKNYRQQSQRLFKGLYEEQRQFRDRIASGISWYNYRDQEKGWLDCTSTAWQTLTPGEQMKYAKQYQLWYARKQGKAVEQKFVVSKAIFIMILVPPGRFWMGSPANELGQTQFELPRHIVTIKKPYWIGKHEVSQKIWQQVMSNNPSLMKGLDKPVEQVNWNDCADFCRITGLQLPSEAQWEYACRAGVTTAFFWGNIWQRNRLNSASFWLKRDLVTVAQWKNIGFEKNWRAYKAQTAKVGCFWPNGFGLHDTLGNVIEWCQDSWHHNYQNAPPDEKPWVTPGANKRVLRGGRFLSPAQSCRCALRVNAYTNTRHFSIGFRVVKAFSPQDGN